MSPTAFFDRTFDEALTLSREARDYLAQRSPGAPRGSVPEARLVESCETLRLTARLTQVMAWLLVQKAVHAGEMTREEAAAPKHRLSGHAVCAKQDRLQDLPVPPQLDELLSRSHSLYQRIARLDSMMAAAGGADEDALS